jgi:hypothetical protein
MGWNKMIKIVNGLPEKLVEMDEQVMIIKQMNQDAGSTISKNCRFTNKNRYF